MYVAQYTDDTPFINTWRINKQIILPEIVDK